MDMHHHTENVEFSEDVAIGLRYPVTATLSFADRAPSPTCPFIKN